MDKSIRPITSSHESEENQSLRTSMPIFDGNNPTTLRERDVQLQDLRRENFDLKLRIYFLEEQTQTNNPNATPTTKPSNYELNDPSGSSRVQISLQSHDQVHSTSTRRSPPTATDSLQSEISQLNDKLRRCHEENENLQQIIQTYSTTEFRERQNTSTPLRTSPRGTFTNTHPTLDSQVDTKMPTGYNNVQIQLNSWQQQERKLNEKIDSLEKELKSCRLKAQEAAVEWEKSRQQYEIDIRNLNEQYAKSERVFRQLKRDYDARVSEAVKHTADHDSYRHEPLLARIRLSYPLQEQTNANVNNDRYIQQIHERDLIITELENKIRAQIQLTHPTSDVNDELVQRLKEQNRVHIETAKQLQLECEELRRNEKYLRKKVDDLSRLVDTPNVIHGLPPLPRRSTSVKVEHIEQVEDPRTSVAQVTLQLRNDAENLTSLTECIQQMIQERDEYQKKIAENDRLLQQLRDRELEVENRIHQRYLVKIESIELENESLQNKIKDRDRQERMAGDELDRLRRQTEDDYQIIRRDHEEEQQRLEREIQQGKQRINELEKELIGEKHRYEELNNEYSSMKRTNVSSNTEDLKDMIEIQKQKLNDYRLEFEAQETTFNQKLQDLRQERDTQKSEVTELQQHLEDLTHEYDELQNRFDQVNVEQIQTYKYQIEQNDQERDRQTTQIQSLQEQNQELVNRYEIIETTLIELKRSSEQSLEEQADMYENRLRDLADENTRIKQELNELGYESENAQEWKTRYESIKSKFDDLQTQYESILQQFHALQTQHESTNQQFESLQNKRNRIETDNQTITEENNKLKEELDQIEYRIRLRINEEIEDKYRLQFDQLTDEKDTEIQNLQNVLGTLQTGLQQANDGRNHLAKQLQEAEDELQQARQTIVDYEQDIVRLTTELKRSENIHDIPSAFENDLRQAKDQIRKLTDEKQSYEADLLRYQQQIQILTTENVTHTNNKTRPSSTYERLNVHDPPYQTTPSQSPRPRPHEHDNQVDQYQAEIREKEKALEKLQSDISDVRDEAAKIQIQFRIRISELESDLATERNSVQTLSEELHRNDQELQQFRKHFAQTVSTTPPPNEQYSEEIRSRDRIIKQQASTIDENEQLITELKRAAQTRERKLSHAKDKLHQAENNAEVQRLQVNDQQQEEYNRININLNIKVQENQDLLEEIQELHKQLNMAKRSSETSPSGARGQYESVMNDLKTKLQQRDERIERLQRSLKDCEQALQGAPQPPNRPTYNNHRVPSPNQMEQQLIADIKDRDRKIGLLHEELSDKDQEFGKLHEDNLALQRKINELQSKTPKSPTYNRKPHIDDRLPSPGASQSELEKKNQEIANLRQELDRLRQEIPRQSDLNSHSTGTTVVIQRPTARHNFDHLTREELLYELGVALQQIENLNQQLEAKSPKVTALHHQINEIRKELDRQNYVNQVLWRKLDVCMDVHVNGSNTQAELAIELANHQEELAKLKNRQNRSSEARAAIHNANSRSSSDASVGKRDSGMSSAMETHEYQRQINEKDEQIRQLRAEINERNEQIKQLPIYSTTRPVSSYEVNRQPRPSGDRDGRVSAEELREIQKQLRDTLSQLDTLKGSNAELNRIERDNQRLSIHNDQLQAKIDGYEPLLARYKNQIHILEQRVVPSGTTYSGIGASETSIGSIDLSRLLEEMHLLRQNLELSINKQAELQIKLDQNLRQSQTPHEFTFAGRGVSYPDLRLVDGSGSFGAEYSPLASINDERRTRPVGSSATELDHAEYRLPSGEDTERITRTKRYIVGDINAHAELRRLVENVKFELKALAPELKDRLHSRQNSSSNDVSIRSVEERFNALDECLNLALALIEQYWKAELPEKNQFDEHPFVDHRVVDENKRLLLAQRKYIQDIEHLRRKCKEQANYLDQLLSQLTSDRR